MIDRIAILGGGSVYIPEFVHAVITRNLPLRELVLIGQSVRNLELVGGFCQRLFDRSGFPVRVLSTPDAAEGVKDATYVINNIRVGGMQARARDEKLPVKHGMPGHESLGAGGISNALRTLPVVLKYAELIQEKAPKAIILNSSHPVGACVEAIAKHTNLTVAGMCDLPRTLTRHIAEILEASEEDLLFDIVGVSQVGWIQDIRDGRRSLMGQFMDWFDESDEMDELFDKDLIAAFQMIPTAGAAMLFHRDAILRKQKASGQIRAEILHEAERRILGMYENERLHEIPDLARARNVTWFDEVMVPLLQALQGRKETTFPLCVMNHGAVTDLPAESSVEVSVAVSAHHLRPIRAGESPRFMRGLFQAFKESDRLIIEAVKARSYVLALQALAVNPFVPSIDTAKAYLDCVREHEHIDLH